MRGASRWASTSITTCRSILGYERSVMSETIMRSSAGEAKHTFQSFWSGGRFSPYEAFCLKSFIDSGHGFDLYTFETNIIAPLGVRVCDASEIFDPDELFFYEEGFGKG